MIKLLFSCVLCVEQLACDMRILLNVRTKILLLTLSLVARLLRYQQNGYARTPLRPTLLKPGWTLMTGNLRKATNNRAPVRFPILANRSP